MSKPKIGIIGGSGLYHIEGFTRQKWVRVKTPFGPPSDAFLTGILAGREVVFLPRHGRGHRLLPGELNHRANLWAMKKLGAAWVISVSAVGSLQKKYRPCDIVLPDQFVDRTKPINISAVAQHQAIFFAGEYPQSSAKRLNVSPR